MSYVLYRASALVYAGVMLLWMGEWLRKGSPQLLPYILAAFGVSLLVIVGMVLLCAWGKMRDLALCLLGHLPQKETWARRAETLRVQVVALYSESWELLHARRVLYQVALLNGLKLFILFCIPYVCQIALDLGGVLTLTETQALSAVMCLITHVLPGVAGMGPPEFAFLLLFSPHLQENTTSVLLLYRIVTYYAQFLISIVVFFRFFWQSSKGTG